MKKTTMFIFGLAGMLSASVMFSQNLNQAPLKHIKRFALPEGITADDYMPKTIVFKVSPQFRGVAGMTSIQHPQLQLALNYLGVAEFGRKFPNHKAPLKEKNELGQKYADLSLIYQLTYTNGVDIEKAINQLLATGALTYAEPHYNYKLYDYEPNDTRADSVSGAQRNAFKRIRAYKAWDLGLGGSHGSASTVVAIVDSGSDLDHPDLSANINHNTADPIDGNDNDGDGYTDNFNGWDLGGADYVTVVGDNDPNVMGANNNHGSHVSGCASEVSDNGTGGAGIGFDCSLMIVKAAADNDTRGAGGVGYIIAGYEGITYAADHGAHVINCSWGGAGGGSFGQDVVDYATINMNSLVVAAAGNDGINTASYPASYTYVLSVAATNSTSDGKASFSNYDYTVDIGAPGNGIDATVYNDTYTSMSGTSMASPIVAGAAGLVKTKFPTYTAMQIGQRLKQTTDNNYMAYNATTNPNITNPAATQVTLQNKLGKGRLNAYRALVDPAAPSVVFANEVIDDHNDNAIVVGDTIFINGDFINYLAATSAGTTASIKAVVNGANVTVVDTTTTLGAMATLSSTNNAADPFSFVINTGTPQNTVITFRVLIKDGSYVDQYFINVTVNVDYVNISINDVATTVTSKGRVGWNQDAATEGLGFSYLGTQMLYEGGLMVGTSSTAVSDHVRGSTGTASDVDFQSTLNAARVIPSVFSEFDVHGAINDAPAVPTQNLDITHNAYAWSTPGNTKYVIVEYIIKNSGGSPLNNLYAGISADWDIDATTYANNKSDYSSAKMMGYTYCTDAGGKWAGIQLLTNSAPPVFYVIDNVAGGGGGMDINDAGDYYSTADKYLALSTNRLQGGNTAPTGNDVLNVMSSGPYTINSGDSVVVAFALIAGEDLLDIEKSADSAYVNYNGVPIGIKHISGASGINVYPNPSNGVLNFVFEKEAENVTIELVNLMGQIVKTVTVNNVSGKCTIDVSTLAEGSYTYKVKYDKGKQTIGKIIVTKGNK